MPRHVGFQKPAGGAAVAVVALLLSMVGLVAGPAGSRAYAQALPPRPTIVVTPAGGAAVGDTLTVSGSGFARVPLGRPPVALCAAEPFPHGTPYSGTSFPAIEAQCTEPTFADVAADGTFTVELPVTTPHATIVWAGGPHLGAALTWSTAAAPVSIEAPSFPRTRVSLTTAIAYAGQAPQGRAVFDEVPNEIRMRACRRGILDSPTSPHVVVAACNLGPSIVLTPDAVGEVVGSLPLPAGTEAVWFGGPAESLPAGGAAAIAVHDPSVAVTPTRDLVDGQTVRLTLDDLGPGGRGQWSVAQCDARILPASPGADISLYCSTGVPATVAADGTLAADLTVARRPTLGPASPLPTPDCARARSCAIVAHGWFDDGQPPALYGMPVTFAAPGLPTVVPHAGVVGEGDAGPVVGHVPVRLSAPSATPVTVSYTTFDPGPSAPWAATSGTDFDPTSGTLTFAPGATAASIPVAVIGDTAAEGTEVALVALTDVTGANIGGFAGIGGVTIVDDD